MMNWTDRHCRYLYRLLSQETLLYTEMVAASALVRGGALHLLAHDSLESPVALQLGGAEPAVLARAARMGQEAGYDEINLNVGCPSDRVRSGAFGAVLMTRPALVAECVAAMRAATDIDVTIKCRIGVDDQNPAQVLPDFLSRIAASGCQRVVIHARKAWLCGVSPKENREIPPLDYNLVMEMKAAFSDLHISVNGGITSLASAEGMIAAGIDGVMIGRAAYQKPADILCAADRRIFGKPVRDSRPDEAVHAMLSYIEAHLSKGGRLHHITRHMLGLFAGRPGAGLWRRALCKAANKPHSGPEDVEAALQHMQNHVRAA